MFKIKVIDYVDGIFTVQIKRPLGTVEKREFTKDAFKEYMESVKSYCEHKGYKIHLLGKDAIDSERL
jgi:hypothetical protein